jgi:hypothetical protein
VANQGQRNWNWSKGAAPPGHWKRDGIDLGDEDALITLKAKYLATCDCCLEQVRAGDSLAWHPAKRIQLHPRCVADFFKQHARKRATAQGGTLKDAARSEDGARLPPASPRLEETRVVKCGHCKGAHASAADVRACWQSRQAAGTPRSVVEPPDEPSAEGDLNRRAMKRRSALSSLLPLLEEIIDSEFRDALSDACRSLGRRQADILLRRLGVGSEDVPTLQDLGAEYGVTRERIRQLEDKALLGVRMGNTAAARTVVAKAKEASVSDQSLTLAALSWLPDAPFGKSVRVLCRLSGQSGKEAARSSKRLLAETSLPSAPTAAILDHLQPKSVTRRIVIEAAWWPAETSSDVWWTEGPVRNVRGEFAGSFRSSKLRRAVQFESQLERKVLEQLEIDDRVARYQEQPFTLEVPLVDGTVPYTPDVLVEMVDGRTAIVEVKPRFHLSRGSVLFRAATLVDWAASHGIGVFIGESPTRSLCSFVRRAVRPDVAEGLARLTARGPVGWHQYQRFQDEHDVRLNEFIAAVVQFGYVHQEAPFVLRRATDRERELLKPLRRLAL